MALSPPAPVPGTTQQETSDLWTRFCAAVHDSLIRSASRTLPSFRQACCRLWPRFTAPVVVGTYAPKEFSKLLVAGRTLFQDESLLNPSILSARPPIDNKDAPTNGHSTLAVAKPPSSSSSALDLTALLPTVARLLLLSAYMASHNVIRHDLTLFSTYYHGRKRRRGGGGGGGGGHTGGGHRGSASKHRKIARKLLGAHAFVLERMMAIFEAVRREWCGEDKDCIANPAAAAVGAAGLDADVAMAIATLSSLRLLVRVSGGGDVMDRGGKWRINVGWEVIRGVGRSIGVEVEEWLIE
jgi:origin recognition complex subunit 5